MGDMQKATRQMVEAATKLHASDDIEIDDDTEVSDARSEGGGGVWVKGWLWVPESELAAEVEP